MWGCMYEWWRVCGGAVGWECIATPHGTHSYSLNRDIDSRLTGPD